MTTIEISNNLTDEQLSGFMFADVRDNLEKVYAKSRVTSSEYEDAVKKYLNAAQAFFFESDLTRRFEVVNAPGWHAKREIEIISGQSVDCAQDIQRKVEAYCQDEKTEFYKQNFISPVPRAFSMVLMDFLLDEVRPNTYD